MQNAHPQPLARSGIKPPNAGRLPAIGLAIFVFAGNSVLGMQVELADISESGGPKNSNVNRRAINLPSTPFNYSRPELPRHFRTLPAEFLEQASSHPLTDAGATLGRVLFYDQSLSRSGTTSCASCHVQKFAFTDPRRFSVGHDGRTVRRNSMSLINLSYSISDRFFWDERAHGLKAQVLMPIENEIEMGHHLPELVSELDQDPIYDSLFLAAFGSSNVTADRIATALSMFVRSIVSYRSAFDQAVAEADSVLDDFDSFTTEQNLGKRQFFERGCAECHLSPGRHHDREQILDLETSPFNVSLRDRQAAIFQIEGAVVNGIDSDDHPSDRGKAGVSGVHSHLGAFRSPSLRNVEVTAPYMHDGRFPTLDSVIEHYNWSVRPHPNLDRRLQHAVPGIAIPEREKVALVEFLKTLTDRPLLSDPRFSDPFVRSPDQRASKPD